MYFANTVHLGQSSNIQTLNIDGLLLGCESPPTDPLMIELWGNYPHVDTVPQISIVARENGLLCLWHAAPNGTLKYFIDVEKFIQRQRSFPASKQGVFNQALGNRSKHIIDATGGWGSDALMMCAQGYQVTILERNPLMVLLLSDAMARLARSEWADHNQVMTPKVINVNAIEFLSNIVKPVDCVYLDPMFPPKRKRSAAVNKHMQILQWLVGVDADAGELACAALNSICSRVVVKRPDHAEPLVEKPSQRLASKLIHYDVYLKDAYKGGQPN